MPRVGVLLLVLFLLVQGIALAWRAGRFVRKYLLTRELDLPARYGARSWVVITGASSGQGRELARQFAARGFNLLLIGSVRSHPVATELRRDYGVNVDVIEKDFGRAFENGFFDDIAAEFGRRDISVLVNNVGHRSAWLPYHEQPADSVRDTIACGTLVQCRLTQLALQRFVERRAKRAAAGLPPLRTALVFITAQCLHGNVGLAASGSNEITVPHLTVYEPTNAFGYYHACSVYEEYCRIGDPALGRSVDVLNVTPGAVLTENTQYLRGTIGAVPAERFAENILRLLGNVQGPTCAHWGHALTSGLLAVAPRLKHAAPRRVGRAIADHCMDNYEQRSRYATE